MLTYALSKAKLDAAVHRCDFSTIYRPGSANVYADILSRYPGIEETQEIAVQ